MQTKQSQAQTIRHYLLYGQREARQLPAPTAGAGAASNRAGAARVPGAARLGPAQPDHNHRSTPLALSAVISLIAQS